jgi:hypothetical protein
LWHAGGLYSQHGGIGYLEISRLSNIRQNVAPHAKKISKKGLSDRLDRRYWCVRVEQAPLERRGHGCRCQASYFKVERHEGGRWDGGKGRPSLKF